MPTLLTMVRERKPGTVHTYIKMMKRYKRYYMRDRYKASEGGQSVFAWARIGRWFCDLMDEGVGKGTLKAGFSAFRVTRRLRWPCLILPENKCQIVPENYDYNAP